MLPIVYSNIMTDYTVVEHHIVAYLHILHDHSVSKLTVRAYCTVLTYKVGG